MARTGIRCGVNASYLCIGGHRLGKWSPVTTFHAGLDLDLEEAQFKRSGGDGLCKKCRAAAERRLAALATPGIVIPGTSPEETRAETPALFVSGQEVQVVDENERVLYTGRIWQVLEWDSFQGTRKYRVKVNDGGPRLTFNEKGLRPIAPAH